MTASRITVTILEQLARDARCAVEDGRADSVSAYVSDALQHYGRTSTLRELLDRWRTEDPDGLERAAARAEFGLPGPAEHHRATPEPTARTGTTTVHPARLASSSGWDGPSARAVGVLCGRTASSDVVDMV